MNVQKFNIGQNAPLDLTRSSLENAVLRLRSVSSRMREKASGDGVVNVLKGSLN